jgi:NACalpha-BTF3-like transcription factor
MAWVMNTENLRFLYDPNHPKLQLVHPYVLVTAQALPRFSIDLLNTVLGYLDKSDCVIHRWAHTTVLNKAWSRDVLPLGYHVGDPAWVVEQTARRYYWFESQKNRFGYDYHGDNENRRRESRAILDGYVPDEEEVNTVAIQANCTRSDARRALLRNRNIVDAILDLTP